MNASNGFRSHLMQQFVAAARNQALPPVALVGVAAPTEEDRQPGSRSPRRSSSSLSSLHLSSKSLASQSTRIAASSGYLRRENSSVVSFPRFLSSSLSAENSARSEMEDSNSYNNTEQQLDLSTKTFQNLLKTRRTSSRLVNTSSLDSSYWKNALDRAVQCGLAAPNHKRTEPFVFRRMVAPSNATARLADIAYQVRLQKEDVNAPHHATRKREKWNQIPAFLVALVQGSSLQGQHSGNNIYTPLPYVAPDGEQELEDYAAACAAVQNVMLSLHSENIASKWATGPVVRTPAFRNLVLAEPSDRVVALVMVGEGGKSAKPRRQAKTLDEVLVDL